MEAEITNQNVEDEDADGSETMDEGVEHAVSESTESNESAEESDAERDSNIEDSQDEIHSFSSIEPAEVCESIEQLSSPEPLQLKQRKQESINNSHNQKRSTTDENPPKPLCSKLPL